MDRLEISGAVPADDAERLSDIAYTRRVEPTQDDLDTAKKELVDEIVSGKRIGRLDRAACLENELNRDAKGLLFVRDMDALLGSLFDDDASASGFWLRAEKYLTGVIASHIPQSAVEERAYQTLNERGEG